jgi:ATP-dependent Zn protease
MDTIPWWLALLSNWLPFIVLVFVWMILSRSLTKGRGLWGPDEARITEMKRTNELLERIAVALEKRATPGA